MTSPLASENAKLRDKVEALTERVAYFERLFSTMGESLPAEWGMRGCQARAVEMLVRANGRVVTHENMICAVWNEGREPERALRILQVHLCRARRKLEPFGIKIRSNYDAGYSLTRGRVG